MKSLRKSDEFCIRKQTLSLLKIPHYYNTSIVILGSNVSYGKSPECKVSFTLFMFKNLVNLKK